MLSVGIQDNIEPFMFSGGTKFAVGSGVVDNEWNGDDDEEAIQVLNSELRSGDGTDRGA